MVVEGPHDSSTGRAETMFVNAMGAMLMKGCSGIVTVDYSWAEWGVEGAHRADLEPKSKPRQQLGHLLSPNMGVAM